MVRAVKPTIGRIVHFNAPCLDAALLRTYAAIVCAVNGDGSVNLSAVNSDGTWFPCTSVIEGTTEGTWCWPPRT